MRGDAQRFVTPIRQAVKCRDAKPAEAGGVGAFRRFEPPIEIFLWAGRVHPVVNVAIVSFLINDEAVRTRRDDGRVIFRFHRPNFE